MNNPEHYLRQPATLAGNASLYRAIIGIPNHMTNKTLEEWVVFFESKTKQAVGAHLEALLEKVWCVDTKSWCEDSFIYNVNSTRELHVQSLDGTNGPIDLMLFETGAGGTGIEAIGRNRILYAQADILNMFITPRGAQCSNQC